MQDNRMPPVLPAGGADAHRGRSGGNADGGGTPSLRDGEGAPSLSSAPERDAAAKPAQQPETRKSPDRSPEARSAASRFPESWRDDLAGSDKAFRRTLDRFDSPAALAKAYKELTARLSSGDLRAVRPPPGDATPEQVAAWRAEQGLPPDAAAYVDGLQFADGTVPGEAEKALLASFAEEALKGRWSADQYNQAVSWYFAAQDRLAAARDQADAAFRQEASAGLMREWGHDYAANRNAVAQFFDSSFPADFRDALLTARLPDGRILADHPAFNRAILEVAKALNTAGAVLPNASGLSGLESRIAEIEGRYMRAPRGSDLWKSYWTGDSGARMQKEYRGLLDEREQTRRGRAG